MIYLSFQTLFSSFILWRSEGILRPGAKNILRPLPTKSAVFEVKNRKRAEESKAKHLLFVTSVIFEVTNTYNARNVLNKSISSGRSNNAGG